MVAKYKPPHRLSSSHDITNFDCGQLVLNDWFKKRALKNETQGASRTYVICDDDKVIGYYSLAVGSVIHNQVSGKIKRNMPNPIPVMILGRLAVDLNYQKQGIGLALVKDAVMRTLQASEIAGIKAILVQAINEKAKNFYLEKCGFYPSLIDDLTLIVTLEEIKKIIA